jgi:hypothetical protein
VGSQTSAVSTNYTSYAAPHIASLTLAGSLNTDGGIGATLTGTNFDAQFGGAVFRVYLNNFNLEPPSPTFMASYAAQVINGSDPLRLVDPATALSSVQSWIASLTEITPLVKPVSSVRSGGTAELTIPAGFGASLVRRCGSGVELLRPATLASPFWALQGAIFLIDGVPSNVVQFS